MTISSDLKTIRDSIQQEILALHVKNKIRQVYRNTVLVDDFIQNKIAGGKFDEIPVSLKQTANSGWALIKQFRDAVEADVDLMEFINWHEAITE